MKTTSTAINKVYLVLKGTGGLTVPVYKLEKPILKTPPAEYVVVNSLPISADVMQACTVNINYHVKNLAPGVPAIEKLETGTDAVILLLDKLFDQSGAVEILIDFDSQETIRDEALNEHYSNIRFKVKIINK